MAAIAGIKGEQALPNTYDYIHSRWQYATSSHGDEMSPALIVKARDKEDIKLTLKYAKEHKIAVAVRTGGHQYSGASSTNAPNIQLDLSETFRSYWDRAIKDNDDKTKLAYTSVSYRLLEFNAWLGENKVFVPHGQCQHVALGGHIQTGGYGQLGRSFGLLGDHVREIEYIDHDGNEKSINKTSDPEMFHAFLGGSPGNMGVLTHVWLEVHRDEPYDGAQGLKPLFEYHKHTLENLLKMVVEMSDDENFPRNYDLCVSVLSSRFNLSGLFPGIDQGFKEKDPDKKFETQYKWPRTIAVYAQWVPLDANDKKPENMDKVNKWFERILDAGKILLPASKQRIVLPMSKMTSQWIFKEDREFDFPYVKRTYVTNSRTLGQDGFVPWASGRITEVVESIFNQQYISAQFQCYGGKNSMVTRNAGNGTAYSWRDLSMIATMDNFYAFESAKKSAEEWQAKNDREGLGPHGKLGKEDRRVLWGSWGSYDLDSVWKCYYEDESKYHRLRKARARADPDGIFTPNAFCVKRAS